MQQSADYWKERLTPSEYYVLREAGTEAPFSGEYNNHQGVGTYRCKACLAPLFDSPTKFDALCGWPSFYDAIPAAVLFREDYSHGMHRVEVLCASCESHLGHLFDDAPQTPTGNRYCINSICLTFEEKE